MKSATLAAGYERVRIVTDKKTGEFLASIRPHSRTGVIHASITTKPRAWSADELDFLAKEIRGQQLLLEPNE